MTDYDDGEIVCQDCGDQLAEDDENETCWLCRRDAVNLEGMWRE